LAAGESGRTQAVATVTAAKTPIEAWHSCGMKSACRYVRPPAAPPRVRSLAPPSSRCRRDS
jgi:hypothetical protein